MTHSPFKSNHRRFLKKWGTLAIITLTFACELALTWRKWPDIIIDFGRELYIPWQLANGKVLYRDIAFFNGPLSPYFNALWMRIIGVSLTSIVVVNLLMLIILTFVVYKFIQKTCDEITAFLSTLAFLVIFAFGHLTPCGNYNFICPYSHELTHGIFVGFLMILLLWRYLETFRVMPVFLAGLCMGCCFLGKPEVFVAAASTAIMGMFWANFASKTSRSRLLHLTLLITGFFLPILIFFCFFAGQMSWQKAFWGVLTPWSAILGSNVTLLPYYQNSMGIDRPLANLQLMIMSLVAAGLIIGLAALVERYYLSLSRHRLFFTVSLIIFLALLLLKIVGLPLLIQSRALPLLSFLIFGGCIYGCYRNKTDQKNFNRMAALAMLSTFAFFFLPKMILNARLHQAGFALAMPATLILIITVVWALPSLYKRTEGKGLVFRRIMLGFLIVDLSFLGWISFTNYHNKNYQIRTENDFFFSFKPEIDPRGYAVNELLKYIDSYIPPYLDFIVLPEGIMINYLARRLNPTPFITFLPPEITIFGEEAMLEALQKHPPAYVILINQDSKYNIILSDVEDYSKTIMNWVKVNYSYIYQISPEPISDKKIIIQVMKRQLHK